MLVSLIVFPSTGTELVRGHHLSFEMLALISHCCLWHASLKHAEPCRSRLPASCALQALLQSVWCHVS